jgi:hypothetical protein
MTLESTAQLTIGSATHDADGYGGVTAAIAALRQVIEEAAAFCIAESGGGAVPRTSAP